MTAPESTVSAINKAIYHDVIYPPSGNIDSETTKQTILTRYVCLATLVGRSRFSTDTDMLRRVFAPDRLYDLPSVPDHFLDAHIRWFGTQAKHTVRSEFGLQQLMSRYLLAMVVFLQQAAAETLGLGDNTNTTADTLRAREWAHPEQGHCKTAFVLTQGDLCLSACVVKTHTVVEPRWFDIIYSAFEIGAVSIGYQESCDVLSPVDAGPKVLINWPCVYAALSRDSKTNEEREKNTLFGSVGVELERAQTAIQDFIQQGIIALMDRDIRLVVLTNYHRWALLRVEETRDRSYSFQLSPVISKEGEATVDEPWRSPLGLMTCLAFLRYSSTPQLPPKSPPNAIVGRDDSDVVSNENVEKLPRLSPVPFEPGISGLNIFASQGQASSFIRHTSTSRQREVRHFGAPELIAYWPKGVLLASVPTTELNARPDAPVTGADELAATALPIDLDACAYLDSGSVWDVYRVPPGWVPSIDGPAVLRICHLASRAVCEGRDGWDRETVIDAIMIEHRAFTERLVALQGRAVPHYVGLWAGVEQATGLLVSIQSFAGTTLPEGEGLDEDEKRRVRACYESVHACGVVQRDVERRHWLRDESDAGRVLVIDFDHCVIRGAAGGEESEAQARSWDALVKGEMQNVERCLR